MLMSALWAMSNITVPVSIYSNMVPTQGVGTVIEECFNVSVLDETWQCENGKSYCFEMSSSYAVGTEMMWGNPTALRNIMLPVPLATIPFFYSVCDLPRLRANKLSLKPALPEVAHC